MPLQTCVSLCVIVSLQAGARAKKSPTSLSGAKEGQSARVFPSAPPGQPAKAASVPTLRSRSNPTVTLTLNSHQSAIVPKVWQHQLTSTGRLWLVQELPKNRGRTEVPATLQWQHWCYRQAHTKTLNHRCIRVCHWRALAHVGVIGHVCPVSPNIGTSYNLNDVRNLYCGNFKVYHEPI
jgi:hypothetical protein